MRHLISAILLKAASLVVLTALCGTATAQTSDPAIDQLKAQQALAELQKAVAEAQKAQAEAELAAAQAKFGGLASSGIKGEADIAATNAGAAEGLLLGTTAVGKLAEAFAARIGCAVKGRQSLVLATPTTVPAFELLVAFEAQHLALQTMVTKAQQTTGEPTAKTESIAVAAAALPFISNLLSYAKTDYKFINIEVSSTDEMLLRDLADRLVANQWTVSIPALYLPQANLASTDMVSKLGDLDKWSLDAKQRLLRYGEDKKAAESALQKDPKNEDLKARLKKLQANMATWQAVSDAIDALSKRLFTADDKGNTAINSITRQANVRKVLSDKTELLVVQLHKVAATGYAKKNLWSSLGANPFFVMGGAVASYVLVDGASGAVRSAQLLPYSGGYHSVSELDKRVNEKAETVLTPPPQTTPPQTTPPKCSAIP